LRLRYPILYGYRCEPCGKSTEVVKSVVDFDRVELCPACQSVMRREISRRIWLSGTKVEEKVWQPALGRGATNSELRAEAKAKGWTEVGNERPEKHLKPELSEYPTFTSDEIRALTSKP
jgi:putative FmdB family regulatory protein